VKRGRRGTTWFGAVLASLALVGVTLQAGAAAPASAATTVVDTAFSSALGSGFNAYVQTVKGDSAGRVVVGGLFDTLNGGPAKKLIRLNADGTVDAAFRTALGDGFNSQVSVVAVDLADRVIAGGTFTTVNGTTSTRLARINSDGTVDAAFSAALGTGFNGEVTAVVTDGIGRVVVGGSFTTFNGVTVNRIARLNADGTLDTGFRTALGTGFDNSVNDIAIMATGRILVAGAYTKLNNTPVNTLVLLESNGALATGFSDALGTGFNSSVDSIAVDGSGRILAGGGWFSSVNGVPANRLARLNSDGTVDQTFSSALGSGFNQVVTSVAAEAAGRVVVGGNFTSVDGITSNRLALLNDDGTVDQAYSAALGTGFTNYVQAVAFDGSGRILAGGTFIPLTGTNSSMLAGLLPQVVTTATVTFNANQGTGSMTPQTASAGTALRSNTFTRTGFTFTGWNTAADGTGTGYANGATTFPFTSNATLYAQWAPIAATVTFDANQGTGTMAPQTASAPTTLAANTFTRAGFTFEGWNTAADGTGTAYGDTATYPFTANATLYAQWAAILYTITFDANEGTGTMAPQAASGPTALEANAFTRSGFTFSGWNTTADGTGTPYANAATYPFGADATLYAQWAPIVYTVVFDANGGTGTMAPQAASGPTALTANAFARAQYTFVGWDTAADGSGAGYPNGWTYLFQADATLYAQWAPVPYTVVFDANGGSGTMADQIATGPTALTTHTFTRTGYAFSGWSTTEDATSGVAYAENAVYPFTADATLYAQWTALPVPTITVALSSATPTFGQPLTVTATVAPAMAGVEVVLYDGLTVLTQGTTDASGQAVLTVARLPIGVHALTVQVPGSSVLAPGSSFPVPVTVEPGPDQRVTLSVASVPAGDQVTILGEGFVPGELVTGVVHSDPIALGTEVADAGGVVRFVFTVPAGFAPGLHTAVLTGAITGTLSATFTVTAPATTGSLAATGGADLTMPVVFAALLVLAGIAVLARRRRAA
jgi:uncharacterized delta-60 repeat protein/uncharacterized repeat protein (TIGR02543 family)